MIDITVCDVCIRTWIMENNCQGLSSVYKNGESSYQLLSIIKGKWLKTVVQ